MKILLINKFYYLKGGTERHFFELRNVLEEKGHEVIVFSTENKKNIKTGKNEYFIPELKMSLSNFFNGFKLFYNPQAIRKLKKIITEHKIDVAHVHNISHHFSPSILKVLKEKNIPIVITVHDYKLVCPNYKLFNKGNICEKCSGKNFYQCTLNKCIKNSYLGSLVMTLEAYWAKWRKYYSQVDVFIAPSHFMEIKLRESGIDSSKIKYLPNFLKEEESYNEVKKEVEDYILFFGRLSEEKGVDVLLKALPKIKDRKIKLKIVGEGKNYDDLRFLAKKLEINNRVEFMGYKDSVELKALIRNSKLVVAPSIWYENAPYSILESYAQSRPVIGANLGGINEMIVIGVTGETFLAGNDDDLAQKINVLLENSQNLERIGQNAQNFLKEKFGQDRYYEVLIKIYKNLLLKNIDKNDPKC